MLKYVEDFRIIKEYKRLKVEVTENGKQKKKSQETVSAEEFFSGCRDFSAFAPHHCCSGFQNAGAR